MKNAMKKEENSNVLWGLLITWQCKHIKMSQDTRMTNPLSVLTVNPFSTKAPICFNVFQYATVNSPEYWKGFNQF